MPCGPSLLRKGLGDGLLDGCTSKAAGNDVAFRVQQDDGRDRLDAESLRDSVLRPPAEERLGPRLILAFQEPGNVVGRGIEARADEDRAGVGAVGLVGRAQVRKLLDAASAPGGPEVEQDELTSVLLE
jgi:hypothetical protein